MAHPIGIRAVLKLARDALVVGARNQLEKVRAWAEEPDAAPASPAGTAAPYVHKPFVASENVRCIACAKPVEKGKLLCKKCDDYREPMRRKAAAAKAAEAARKKP